MQESVIPLWESTRQFRIYSPFLVPGPVQTAAYIRALLRRCVIAARTSLTTSRRP